VRSGKQLLVHRAKIPQLALLELIVLLPARRDTGRCLFHLCRSTAPGMICHLTTHWRSKARW